MIIPVFFLLLLPVSGQYDWKEPYVSSLGGAFVIHTGPASSSQNQAGLGSTEGNSICIQHCRPYMMMDLGISTLSLQLESGQGAFGSAITTLGVEGLRKTSAWISYGMQLHPGITTGVGIQLRYSSIPEKIWYQPAISCAIGIQARINSQLVTGAHVLHPVGWTSHPTDDRNQLMNLAVGGAYTFIETSTYFLELHVIPGSGLQVCQGLELKLKERMAMMLGMHTRPLSLTGGVAIFYTQWSMHAAFVYGIDSGTTPLSSLSYAW